MYSRNYFTRITALFIVMMSLTFWTSVQASAADQEIKCFLDGKELHFDVSPILKEGVTYVPMRVIFEAQGATLKWDNNVKTISAVRGETNLFYMVKEGRVFVNGKENVEVIQSISHQNHTLVPLRFISEVLGSKVSWDAVTHSVTITSPAAEEKITASTNRTLALSGQEVSKRIFDERNQFEIKVTHYGIKNNQLYSLLQLTNMDNKDILINFKPSDKKIIDTLTKEKDPMPSLNLANCTVVKDRTVIDNIGGKIYNLPEFSTNQECVSSNQAQRDALEEWEKKNSGISAVGSNTVIVRRYIQDPSGGLQNFTIPANTTDQLILVAPVGGKDKLVVEGSYFIGGITNKTIEFTLDYEVVSELDLGIYSWIYTQPVY